jgi:hypothetical protein
MCCVWIVQQAAFVSANIKGFVFPVETQCVFCEVETGCLSVLKLQCVHMVPNETRLLASCAGVVPIETRLLASCAGVVPNETFVSKLCWSGSK